MMPVRGLLSSCATPETSSPRDESLSDCMSFCVSMRSLVTSFMYTTAIFWASPAAMSGKVCHISTLPLGAVISTSNGTAASIAFFTGHPSLGSPMPKKAQTSFPRIICSSAPKARMKCLLASMMRRS